MKQLDQLKNSQIHLCGFSILIGCAVAAYGLGIRPVLNAGRQLTQVRDTATQLTAQAAGLEQENVALASELRTLKSELADRYDVESLHDSSVLDLISGMLAEHELQLANFREQANAEEGSCSVEVQFRGSYSETVHFLADLRQLPRPVRIVGCALSPTEATGQECSVRLKLEFTRALELSTRLSASLPSKQGGIAR